MTMMLTLGGRYRRAMNPGRANVKTSILRTTLGSLSIVALLLVSIGCESDNENNGRLICEVVSVNGGNPLISAYVNITSSGDTYQTIDSAVVNFYTRPYGCTVSIPCGSGAFTMFNITRYDLIWEDVSSREALEGVDLASHNVIGGSINVLVPLYENAGAAVLVVGPEMKDEDWFRNLGQAPLPMSFEANARLVFHGHEVGSNREASLETAMRVLFLPSIIED
jgi:hypothetical protein